MIPQIPLQPLAPKQRLGWLQPSCTLVCFQELKPHWTQGKLYPAVIQRVGIQGGKIRRTRNGQDEELALSGEERLIRICDDKRDWHRFLPTTPLKHPLVHDWDYLVDHFIIPAVPDIAMHRPDEYQRYVERLKQLES